MHWYSTPHYLPPATKLGQGYVCLQVSVILITEGVSASVHAGIAPPGADLKGADYCPKSRSLWRADTPQRTDTSYSFYHPLVEVFTPPKSRHRPQEQTPPSRPIIEAGNWGGIRSRPTPKGWNWSCSFLGPHPSRKLSVIRSNPPGAVYAGSYGQRKCGTHR